MTRHAVIRTLSVLFSLGLPCGFSWAQVMAVDQAAGAARIERGGVQLALRPGDPLIEHDVVRTGAEGRVRVLLAGRGFLELGARSVLIIDRLPYATFAPSLQTTLRLQKGFLRAVWKPSQVWPLQIQINTLRADLAAGEYFFETATPSPTQSTACVAQGGLQLFEEQRAPLTLSPSRCYRFENQGPRAVDYSEQDWIVLRKLATIAPPQARAAAAGPRRPRFVIENLPARSLSTPADTRNDRAAPTALSPIVVDAAASGTAEWTLQIASVSTRAEAEREVQKLQAAGYSSEIVTAEVRGKTWHRIRLTGRVNADEARRISETLRTTLGYSSVWITKSK